MEPPGLLKLGTVIALLALSGVLVCVMPATNAVIGKIPLRVALNSVGDWRNEGFSPLDKELMAALNLDDYLNALYSRGEDTAYLYVGYYRSAEKIGAAHDPIVCFYGQGYVISESAGDVVVLKDGKRINCSYMVVESNATKEVIVYWFQSYRSTCSNTVSQKFVSFWNRFSAKREDIALIRIVVPVRDSAASARQVAHDFIDSFYPVFIQFVDNA
jgi:EpsI family protein